MKKPCKSKWLGHCKPGISIGACDLCGINLAIGDAFLPDLVCPACKKEKSAKGDKSAKKSVKKEEKKERGRKLLERRDFPASQRSVLSIFVDIIF